MLQGAGRNLLPYATAAQNVAFAQRSIGRSARRDLAEPTTLLRDLGLGDVAERPVAELSGGEQQRVAVVAAVAAGPGLLLADEPTSQLDTGGRDDVLDLLHRVNERFGTTIVAVTHDPEVGRRLGRTVTMRFGRVGRAGRGDRQYAVIGRDGGLQLPDDLRARPGRPALWSRCCATATTCACGVEATMASDRPGNGTTRCTGRRARPCSPRASPWSEAGAGCWTASASGQTPARWWRSRDRRERARARCWPFSAASSGRRPGR